MNGINLIELSKAVSHALRHEPWEYELELSDDGWVNVDQLLHSLQRCPKWHALSCNDLREMIEKSEKKRHEIKGDKIRASYGHSVEGKFAIQQSKPPMVLFHGTAPESLVGIKEHGLVPMGRQYVHLSVDKETATQVGRRKSATPIILTIDTRAAMSNGVNFYIGNDKVWLADQIPWKYIFHKGKSVRDE